MLENEMEGDEKINDPTEKRRGRWQEIKQICFSL